MLFQLFIAAIAGLTATATQNGPSSLYTLLNGQTFNPPGYTIVMYQSCMQNQNAGNPCGSFSGYQSSNGQYTYQLYGPEAAVSPTCSRTFKLTLACGATMQMSGVNENPTCVYSATLSLPEVCGVDLTVGAEAASVSPTALPPTSSPTETPTETATATGTMTATQTVTASTTSTPLFVITAYPTTTSTMTLTATATPLFMVTAYPTTSPVNVTPTSTPLFFYTPYPSVQANGTVDLLAQATALLNSGNPTSVILGSVALGVVGLGAIAATVAYFRNGGTVGGFLNKIKGQKGAIQQFANALPLTAEQKEKLGKTIDEPTSLVPASVLAKAEDLKHQAEAANQSIIQMLPPSMGQAVAEKQIELIRHIKENVSEKVAAVSSFAPVATAENLVPASIEPLLQTVVTEAPLEAVATTLVQVVLKPEEMEAFKAFLEQKSKE